MINSASNSQVKNIISLQTKAKARNKQNCFVIEGIRMFMEAEQDRIVKTYVTDVFFEKAEQDILTKIKASDYELVSEEVFKRITDTITPQGILAIIKKKELTIDTIEEMGSDISKPFYMILEDIQDPGNLGTIVRTAEAAGVSGIIMSKGTVDIYNPKVVRSTMGTIFRVPFTYVEDLEEIIEKLQKSGVTVYAAHLNGKRNYCEEDYSKPTAFLIGNEGNGLSEQISHKADSLIKIPMFGKVESLNAACAATILMYEAVRQRM